MNESKTVKKQVRDSEGVYEKKLTTKNEKMANFVQFLTKKQEKKEK